MTLNDTQGAARLASIEGNDEDGYSFDSDAYVGNDTEKLLWDFLDLQRSVRRDTPSLQATRVFVLNIILGDRPAWWMLRQSLTTGFLLYLEI